MGRYRSGDSGNLSNNCYGLFLSGPIIIVVLILIVVIIIVLLLVVIVITEEAFKQVWIIVFIGRSGCSSRDWGSSVFGIFRRSDGGIICIVVLVVVFVVLRIVVFIVIVFGLDSRGSGSFRILCVGKANDLCYVANVIVSIVVLVGSSG